MNFHLELGLSILNPNLIVQYILEYTASQDSSLYLAAVQKYFLPIRDYHPLWSYFPESSSYYIFAIGLIRVRSSLLTE